MHDPRGKVGVGLGYAINKTGADHLAASTIRRSPAKSSSFKGLQPLGITEALPPRTQRPRRGPLRRAGKLEQLREGDRPLLLRAGPALVHPGRGGGEAVHAATGWDVA